MTERNIYSWEHVKAAFKKGKHQFAGSMWACGTWKHHLNSSVLLLPAALLIQTKPHSWKKDPALSAAHRPNPTCVPVVCSGLGMSSKRDRARFGVHRAPSLQSTVHFSRLLLLFSAGEKQYCRSWLCARV